MILINENYMDDQFVYAFIRDYLANKLRREIQSQDWNHADAVVKADHNLKPDDQLPEEYREEAKAKAYSLWQERGGNDEPTILALANNAMQCYYHLPTLREILTQ